MTIPTRTRIALTARTGGRCDLCGRRTRLDAHHRKQRSLGGSDDLVNLLGVCRPCHTRIHDNIALSIHCGWLVQSWDEPGPTPVRLLEGEVTLG